MFLSNMIGTFHRFANRSDGLLCSADRPSVRKFRMSALFSPFMLRRLTLRNRIVVSPMCQYSAEGGEPNSWHLTHLGNLALSGAGMLCIEGTAVELEGRITPGDLGLWDDRTEAAAKPEACWIQVRVSTEVLLFAVEKVLVIDRRSSAVGKLHRKLLSIIREDEVCRRLMTSVKVSTTE
jgi:NADH:flavin oxidoreductase / NADH oxidase family